MSNLIDIDLQGYEPDDSASERVNPPHPPGPVGLDAPRVRVWRKRHRPPGPAGL